jgi:hypothetical protein
MESILTGVDINWVALQIYGSVTVGQAGTVTSTVTNSRMAIKR